MAINNKSSAFKADVDAVNIQYQKALKMLHEKIGIKPYDIYLITRNDDGYSNDTFNVTTKKGRELIVRVGHPDNLIRREQEALATRYAFMVNNNNILYDCENGDQIRESLPVCMPSIKQIRTKKFLKLLAHKIRKFHSINVKGSNLKPMNYHLYDSFINCAESEYGNMFYSILDKYKNMPLVFSHNDLTIWNIIYDEKKSNVSLIDFEWSGLNNEIFDIANFIRDVDLRGTPLEKYFLKEYDPKLSVDDVTPFVYVSSFFSYLWTFTIEPKPHIIRYRKSVWTKVNKLYNEIIKKKLVKVSDFVSQLKIKKVPIRRQHHFTPMDLVYELIYKHLHVDRDDIQVLEQLRTGQTNLSFYLRLNNDNEYYVRIGTIHQHLHHAIEADVTKAYAKHTKQGIIYFDPDTGNCIKSWIIGSTPTIQQLKSHNFYDSLIKEIKLFHSLKIKHEVPTIDWTLYDVHKKHLDTKYFNLFKKITKEFAKDKKVLCHNDCAPWNTIVHNNKLYLTDIEWARIGSFYVDVANFIREANIHNTKYEDYIVKHYYEKLDKKKLAKMIYILSCFAYLWTFSHPNFKVLSEYKKTCKK